MIGILAALLVVATPRADAAVGDPEPTTPATTEEPPAEPEPPTWRFVEPDKTVKVVVIAGSIGAFKRDPYAKQIEKMCRNVEVRNLSETGLGTWALKQRFKEQVLANRRIDLRSREHEHWLVFGGGLNSVGSPKSTNHHARNLFVLAHKAGLKVVALSLTPWGDDKDKRFAGIAGLQYRKSTQLVVDFVMKRLAPTEALGSYAGKRKQGANEGWDPSELPDVAVDLYDSSLRDKDAPLRDLAAMRAALQRDASWKRAHADLDDAAREAALERDAQLAAELPRWYLRPELRSFDHVHPNAEGHALIAEIACPSLPASWGCECKK